MKFLELMASTMPTNEDANFDSNYYAYFSHFVYNILSSIAVMSNIAMSNIADLTIYASHT